MQKQGRDKSRLFIDKDFIIHVEDQRIVTPESISEGKKMSERLFETAFFPFGKKPERLLLDLTGVHLESLLACREQMNSTVRELREKYAISAESVKIAVLGINRFISIVASFVFNAAGYRNVSNNVRFFPSEEEALAWLKKP